MTIWSHTLLLLKNNILIFYVIDSLSLLTLSFCDHDCQNPLIKDPPKLSPSSSPLQLPSLERSLFWVVPCKVLLLLFIYICTSFSVKMQFSFFHIIIFCCCPETKRICDRSNIQPLLKREGLGSYTLEREA